MLRECFVLASLTIAGPAVAQDAGHVPPEDCPMSAAKNLSPYAGLEGREVKALSEEDRELLRSGHGMGMALAAELNRYPGPKHVLELASALDLDEEQTRRTQAIFDAMKHEAQRLGRQVIQLETDLDTDFRLAEIGEERLRRAVYEIAQVRGELRLAHLRAHLEMRALLSGEQIERYDRLRGYER